MGKFLLKLPSMGESVTEATLTAWLKDVGDSIDIDDSIVEVATDKVDSDVPSEVSGTLLEKRFDVNDVIQVGEVIAVIDSNEVEEENTAIPSTVEEEEPLQELEEVPQEIMDIVEAPIAPTQPVAPEVKTDISTQRYYSPLVKNIAKKEGISTQELDQIIGTGEQQRVTKKDMLAYLKTRKSPAIPNVISDETAETGKGQKALSSVQPSAVISGEDQVIEMSRMGKLIADHMTHSKNTSVHVQSFIEADVTNLWDWREKRKIHSSKEKGRNLPLHPYFFQL